MRPRTARTALTITALVAAAAMGMPASAAASTVAFTPGDVLVYDAAPGEANELFLTRSDYEFECGPVGTPCVVVSDAVPITSFPTEHCSRQRGGERTIECRVPVSARVELGDRDDLVMDWDGPSVINGGAGNDINLHGKGGDDVIRGEAGNDALFGDGGDDTLEGGDGDDRLEGFGVGVPSEDHTAGRDRYAGGAGRDIVDYDARTERLSLSLDGTANDGAPGEGDDIGVDVERLRGGVAADVITGSAADNDLDGSDGDDVVHGRGGGDNLSGRRGDDELLGEDGQDTIEGGAGADHVDGGAGIDTLYGDELHVCIPSSCISGPDRILARDGLDEAVNCGPGEDTAVLDAGDAVPESTQDRCEHVDRPPAAAPGAAGPPAGTGTPGASPGAGAGTGGAGGGSSPQTDLVVPQIGNLAVSVLRAGRTLRIRYELSEPATVRFTLERAVRRGGRLRHVAVRGSLRHAGRSGANVARFTRRRLAAGRYRLTAVARDAAGNRAPPVRVAVRVAA